MKILNLKSNLFLVQIFIVAFALAACTDTSQDPPIALPSFTAQDCTPGYKPCIPEGPDVDCRNGQGDGPRYTARVEVTGEDVYDLDRDGDGFACR